MADDKASLHDVLSWTASEYTLRQFVTTFATRLPIVIYTTTGFAGATDPGLHEVGADEVKVK